MFNLEEFIEKVARQCHEANRAYCGLIGDKSQVSWEEAPEWQKQSAKEGVKYHLNNRNSTPADSHVSWMKQKEKDGWIYGDVKDPEKKTHPCMVPYEQLPMEQRLKDYVFWCIVRAQIAINNL